MTNASIVFDNITPVAALGGDWLPAFLLGAERLAATPPTYAAPRPVAAPLLPVAGSDEEPERWDGLS